MRKSAWGVCGLLALSLIVAALALSLSQQDAVAQSDGASSPAAGENPFPRRSPAPGLEGGVGWLNTGGPIDLKDLHGKVVLLDFWTFCCINCMHILPDLEYLEHKFPNELVVIGVHSAKFENEKETDAIRDAIMRYGISHPVINDANMVLWRKFNVRSWPTLVLIDPEGNFCGFVSGEGNREVVDEAIQKLVAYHGAKGTLDRTPLHFDLERFAAEPTPLRYPGKVLADPEHNRLFISDTGHNRIIVAGLDGKLVGIIGSGAIGRADGGFGQAQFDHPQGLALVGETLYVADTENHLIRTVNLTSQSVGTLAGTGEQGNFREGGGPLATTKLNSPWDLLVHDGVLYVAMAGPHQIWAHPLGSQFIQIFAGSGREDVIDGSHAKAALAQPSGLAGDDQSLYVCDSEGSAIRRVPFNPAKSITTLAGPSDLPGGQTLFEFGDRIGVGSKARFQHPLGIARSGETLYVADSYNQKVKTISLKKGSVGKVELFAGGKPAGDSLDPVQFSEPGGLTVAGTDLIVADTNNHRIVRIDLETRHATEFKVAGLAPPAATDAADDLAESLPANDVVAVERQTVGAGKAVEIIVEFTLPEGFKLNPAYPNAAVAKSEGAQSVVPDEGLGHRIKATAEGSTAHFSLPLSGEAGNADLSIAFRYGYCRDGAAGVCKVGSASWKVPISVMKQGPRQIRLKAAPVDVELPATDGLSQK